MKANAKISIAIVAAIGIVFAIATFSSCQTDNVPLNTDHLAEFDSLTVKRESNAMPSHELALFVDYSTCIANGMSSPFYQQMTSPLSAAATEYWSIKGDTIEKEEGKVYDLLNDVNEVNYAALDKAIEQMAERDGESVMLTDGELFTQNPSKVSPKNPYMHAAFKKWLLKGHDIHIIAEPYQEVYNGQTFNKKRFFIIFTDDRLDGNIYDRIKEVINLEDFPQVDEFHLSGNYPDNVTLKGNTSETNPVLAAVSEGHEKMEIQEWQVPWDAIMQVIGNGMDDNGTPLANGEKLIGGLHINKNAFGCYRIKDIDVKVYDINNDYFDIYNKLDAGQKVGFTQITPVEIPDFIIADEKEFKQHGNVDLYFDIQKFAPDLTGNPYNYFKIEIKIKDLENILDNSIDMFNFDSIVQEGAKNESISESLKNCVFDPEILNALKGKTLYTIYVKSEKYQ